MLLHVYHANGGCRLPGDEEGSREKCETIAERIAGKGSLSEGLIRGKGKMVISSMSNHSEMEPKVRTRRDEEVGVGFTSIGVTVAEI